MSGTGGTDARERITQLHGVAADLQEASDEGAVYDMIIDAAVDILGFDWCSVGVPTDGYFELRRVSEAAPLDEGVRLLRVDEGVAGKTFQENETVIFRNQEEHDEAKPVRDSFRSGLSVPLGKWGIFQGVASEEGAFDEPDREAAELLASHATAALDRIEHEQALKEKNERLEQFASVVSHDLRNPLNVAGLRLDLVKDDCDSEHLGDIERALDRMEQLIDDLLMLARVGQEGQVAEPLELAALVEECWSTVDSADATARVETDMTVLADSSRLRQLLENLLRNALEHGGPDVTVTIGALDNGFYVEDTGPGLSADDCEQIFDFGYSTNEDGTGFGLSIVQDIVDAHGWDITVSEGSEGGARFEVTSVATPE